MKKFNKETEEEELPAKSIKKCGSNYLTERG